MTSLSRKLLGNWLNLGPRFLPFADVATTAVPLSRLLRLSLFQISVGITMVLLVGTLNRVLIVELNVPASLVGIMVALPLLFAPFRAFIGFKSDQHRCQLGWRRVPYMWNGTLLQFGGLAIMPFALLVLAGQGQAANAPAWIGPAAAALAFLLVGAGAHIVQTVGLALATDLTAPEMRPRVVGLMYVMLLLGMMGSALAFGHALADFTPGRLVQVIQASAVLIMALNSVALWKQEARRPRNNTRPPVGEPTFTEAWAVFSRADQAVRRLAVVGLGTLAFGMAEILLEPYGGQILHLSVGATTSLTAVLAFGSLLGFALASRFIGRGASAVRMADYGALLGLPAFACVILAAPLHSAALFVAGNFLIGFGAALFSHGTLTATMQRAPGAQTGMALGAWGSVQATAAGLGVAASGVLRDLVNAHAGTDPGPWGIGGPASGYTTVYVLEFLLLLVTVVVMVPLIRRARPKDAPQACRAEATPQPEARLDNSGPAASRTRASALP